MQTRVDKISLFGREIFILRDDLLGEFSGNKARKLEYFLRSDLSGFDKIVSFGSSQSNAMYALSLFARNKGLKFLYVSEHISEFLKSNPIGNYKFALQNGMQIFEHKNRREFALSLVDDKTLFIEEGVAQSEAEAGFKSQGEFIDNYADKNSLNFDIFLPSGTGASAAYLDKYTKFSLFTTPCVGDSEFLLSELDRLNPQNQITILNPKRKFHFAKPYLELYKIWKKSCDESGIEFDLIYDPIGLSALALNLERFKNEILYIHQGGNLGNISQLQRYFYKFSDKIEQRG